MVRNYHRSPQSPLIPNVGNEAYKPSHPALAYPDRKTDFIEKFGARVDMIEEFPFLVNRLSPYYDR